MGIRILLLCAGIAIGTPASALAQNGGNIDLQAFKPAMDSRGFITLNASDVLGHKQLSFGLVTNWAKNLLTFRDGANSYQVSNMITPTLIGAVGLKLGRLNLEVGLSLPFQVMAGDRQPDSDNMTPDNPNDDQLYRFDGQGIGDAGIHLKTRLLNSSRGLGVALMASLYLPTASQRDSWLGDGVFAPQLMVLVDKQVGRFRFALNGGVRIRSGVHDFVDQGSNMPVTGERISVGTTLPFGAGISYAVAPQKIDLIGELFGAVPLASEHYHPLEAIAGVKLYLARNSYLTVGGGVGFLPDQGGNPDLRAFLGIVFEPRTGDRDGDGYKDDVDRCPDDPEDFDQFEDSDGCPEPDNDGDGILDKDDKCPNEPENKNGVEDDDGCPETVKADRDNDGIADNDDGCPDEPEDKDGFEDKDGCPDDDNDKDGIKDIDDLCPNRPENYNGNEDKDGCPDKDIAIRVGGGIKVLDNVYFEFDSAVLQERSYNVLNAVAKTLKDNPDISLLEIQGHTDRRGSDIYNLRLSQARAASVRTYLISKQIAPSRLKAKGYGETKLIDKRNTKAAHDTNRRVEFVIRETR